MEKNRLKELNKKREMIQLEHLAKQRQNQETFAAIVQEDKQLKEKLWQSRGAYVYDVWNQCQDNRHELVSSKKTQVV